MSSPDLRGAQLFPESSRRCSPEIGDFANFTVFEIGDFASFPLYEIGVFATFTVFEIGDFAI